MRAWRSQEVSGVLGRCLSSSGGVCRCREVSGVTRDTIHTSSTGPLCPPPFLEPHSLSTGLAFSGGVWRSREVSGVVERCQAFPGGVCLSLTVQRYLCQVMLISMWAAVAVFSVTTTMFLPSHVTTEVERSHYSLRSSCSLPSSCSLHSSCSLCHGLNKGQCCRLVCFIPVLVYRQML